MRMGLDYPPDLTKEQVAVNIPPNWCLTPIFTGDLPAAVRPAGYG
jgi:hypothetical protein